MLFAALAFVSAAARAAGAQPVATVTLDLNARTVAPSPVPFGQRVRFAGAVPDTGTDAIAVWLRAVPRYGAEDPTRATPRRACPQWWIRQPPVRRPFPPPIPKAPDAAVPAQPPGSPPAPRLAVRATETTFRTEAFLFPLPAGKQYEVTVILYQLPDSQYLAPPQGKCTLPTGARAFRFDGSRVADGPAVVATDSITLRFVTDASFQQHVDLDAGAVYGFGAQYAGAATGVHLYLSPISADEDLSEPGFAPRYQLLRRVSLHGGLAVQEVGTSSGVSGATRAGAPFLGVALRGPLYWPGWYGGESTRGLENRARVRVVLQGMRVGGGFIWFKQQDANPLVTEERSKRDLYATLTINLALRDVLAPLGLFFK